MVIVESPTKEKTISRFLNSSFSVRSSYGHVRDLPSDGMGIDEKNDFSPTYKILPKSVRIISALNGAAKNCECVFLATDPDREGEAIAWHLSEILDVKKSKFRRIAFHEITKNAIKRAMDEARGIDLNLVNAQQARRIIDRVVGYKISPLLWAKIKSGLSAGRVQSITVRFVAERALEIKKFREEDYFTVLAEMKKGGEAFKAKLSKWEEQTVEKNVLLKLFAEDYRHKTSVFKKFEDAAFCKNYIMSGVFRVAKAEKSEVRQRPRPPFITSTLQQDAYNKFGFSSDRTMRVAQGLYEGVELKGERAGLITYMRTDSFNLSRDIKEEALRFIMSRYGEEYWAVGGRVYQKKVKGAQEAHEAIHPTSVTRTPEDMKNYLSQDQYKLYDLIWRRFMACQMADAVFNSMSVEMADESGKAVLRAGGRALKFDGYLKVYGERESAQDEDCKLPDLNVGDEVRVKNVHVKEHKTIPPPHYNEASIIRTLEKHGIGRPSTYAVTVKTIIDRGYVKRNFKDKKLLITELGALVTEKLKKFFNDIMDIFYTANIEKKLDNIAEGKEDWLAVMNEFYSSFMKNLMAATEKMTVERPKVKETNEKCPECGNKMVLRESRFGKYLSCSRFPKCRGKIPLDRNGNKVEFFRPVGTEKICSKCKKKKMLLRKSSRGFFLACSGFPKCRNIEPVTEEEAKSIIDAAGGNKKS